MSELVDPAEIERIVGIDRHATRHYARAIRAEQTVYILHSHRCKNSGHDLRECGFSIALDKGIDLATWEGHEDKAVRVVVNRSGRLIPVVPGMRFAS